MTSLSPALEPKPDVTAGAGDADQQFESPHCKDLGAYYTPDEVVRWLVAWSTSGNSNAYVLDPACGDGRFLEGLTRAVGVDVDPAAVARAERRAPRARLVREDFFSWALHSQERFDAVLGNPPFIRYQRFTGRERAQALKLCALNGVELSALSSSWAPFIVGACSLLRSGGRAAFVVPAEIGYAVYARPVLQFLMATFGRVEVVAVREKLFPELAEDCWLLRASDAGATTNCLHFARVDRFRENRAPEFESVSASELKMWQWRLRPLLLEQHFRELYHEAANTAGIARLGELAKLGIGYVTGANSFFHLRPSEVERMAIPRELLRVAVRSNRDLTGLADVDNDVVARWIADDRPIYLLDLSGVDEIPTSVRRYLETPRGQEAQETYKCRNRSPWYSVPDVHVPHAFLTIMSTRGPRMVANSAGAVCTNSVHAVTASSGESPHAIIRAWSSPLTQLSCEIEGHALGGGMLKIEPREARRVLVARGDTAIVDPVVLLEAVRKMRHWRGEDGS